MTMFEKQKSCAQLPQIVKLFPLPEVMLLPQTQLPLNIYEDKYISMVDEALATDRLIAMIQPIQETNDSELHRIGCIGRISSFQETTKGKYHITLLGLCRFELVEEIIDEAQTPDPKAIRRASVDYRQFADDFERPSKERQKLIDRKKLINSIKDMLHNMDLDVDWNDLANTPNEMLVNAISMTSPFQIAEKQALLEALTAADRAELLIALSKISLGNTPNNNDLIQ